VEVTTPGRVLGGRYRLVEELARGGMATVWIADDPLLSRRVAVKILRAELAANEGTRARFRNEAASAAQLAHPNIVATYDTGDDDGTAYIVMELIDGPTLRHLIDEAGSLPVEEVLRIGAQVANALDAAHRAGLIHRDVKPANVLVPDAGPVKVTDFGIAKAAGEEDLTRTGVVMGTARYLAPEQVNGKPMDSRGDVYSLGLVLFEALWGDPPFGGDTDVATAMARLTTTAPSVRLLRPDVPAAVDDIIHRCLARDPTARYDSAGALRDALQSARASTGAGGMNGPGGLGPTRRERRTAKKPARQLAPHFRFRRLVTMLTIVVLATGATAGYLALRDDSSSATGGVAATSTIVAADFDPPPGDGKEDPGDDKFLTDHDLGPAWQTKEYPNGLHAVKAGVGVSLDLGVTKVVKSITVHTIETGWAAELYVSTKPASELKTLADWGGSIYTLASGSTAAGYSLASDTHARSVLVWFTNLPPNGRGNQQLHVQEITVA